MKSIAVFGIVIIILLVIFLLPFEKRAPVGAPTDFYKIAEEITDSESKIYYLGSITFPDELDYTKIESVMSIPLFDSTQLRIVILDFNELAELSQTEVSKIKSLYIDNGYRFILMNFKETSLDDLIEDIDRNEDLIILDYYQGLPYSNSIEIEHPTELNIQYIVMDTITRLIEDYEYMSN
jgi:hypothetical protein